MTDCSQCRKHKDITFQRLIGGNISLVLTQNLPNGTRVLNPKDNPNNDSYININTELKQALIEQAKSFFSPSRTATTTVTSGKCIISRVVLCIRNHFLALSRT